MEPPRHVGELEIAGFATALNPAMLPSVVPPVFRLKSNPDRCFVPPYSFNAGYLCNATSIPATELRELEQAGEITLLNDAIPAVSEFELWIDEFGAPHYQDGEDAHKALSRLALEEIQKAVGALRNGDLVTAESHCGRAISADDRRIEPLAIKAAIRRLNGSDEGERLMAKLAEQALGGVEFRVLVNRYIKSFRKKNRPQSGAPAFAVPIEIMEELEQVLRERKPSESINPTEGQIKSRPRFRTG